MSEQLSPEWREWIRSNLANGCSHEAVLAAMLQGGVATLQAARALIEVAQPELKRVTNTALPTCMPFLASRLQGGNRIDAGDRHVDVMLRLPRPDVALLANVLSDEECDQLIALSQNKLQRSTTVNKETGKHDVIDERTSFGTFFQRGENALVRTIEERLARIMNWPMENGEGLQMLRYLVGGEYKPHFDYFPPEESGSQRHLEQGGQRVATMVLYLNDVEHGGGTTFPDVGLTVFPRKGYALYFAYTSDAGTVDPLSLHAGTPVLGGEKWIATKWLRQHPYR